MELQFEKKTLTCMTQAVRSVKDQELTQEIRLTESMPDVGRVIAGWGQVILRGKEWQGSRISVAGGVMAWVLYEPEDGSEPRMADAWLPFQMQWDGAEAEREGTVRAMPLLRFVDGRNVSARKILIRAGISCLCEGLCVHRVEICGPVETPPDVELLRRSYPVQLPRESGEKTFELEETLDMDGAPIREILSASLQAQITERRVSGDKAVLRGCGALHLIYRCPEGRIRIRDFEIPFSQLAQLEKSYDTDARMDVLPAVTGLETDLTEDHVTVKANLTAQYVISERSMLELVEDAYSARREVGLRQEELHLPVILDETWERLEIETTFSEIAEDLLDAVFQCGFPRITRSGDRAEVETQGRIQLLGRDENGKLRAVSGAWTGSTALGADESSRIDAIAYPSGTLHSGAAAGGMQSRGELLLQLTTQSRRGMPMITGLELGPLRDVDRQRPSLILCRAGKRSLWELAKSGGSTVDAIRGANALEDEPEEGRMLLIPVS